MKISRFKSINRGLKIHTLRHNKQGTKESKKKRMLRDLRDKRVIYKINYHNKLVRILLTPKRELRPKKYKIKQKIR